MRKVLLLIWLAVILALPASALDYTSPTAPADALDLMPVESSDFGKDLWTVVTTALGKLQPSLSEAAKSCRALLALVMLLSVIKTLPGNMATAADLTGVLACGALLLQSTGSMITLAQETVVEISEYGKLLLPVMAAALASQGGITSSSALYAATAFFDGILGQCISKFLVPMVSVYLIMAVASAATGDGMLARLRDGVKGMAVWCLKTLLYIFTGYVSISGVITGNADAATLKATKLTMSGMIPVVGGILADASEAVIVGAGVMKSTVGVYGMVVLAAILILPFLRLGVQYLLLKLTAMLCGVFDCKSVQAVVDAFGSGMGLLLGMTAAECVLHMVSIVCFMKGVS